MMSSNKDNRLDFLGVAKIGDKVWDARFGNGVVANIQDPNVITSCLNVSFDGEIQSYDRYGFAYKHYKYPTLHLGHNLNENLQSRHNAFVNNTMPRANMESMMQHLQSEVQEFLDNPSPQEAADIVMALMHHANMKGYDLLQATEDKLKVVEQRQYGWDNDKKYYAHKKEG